MPKLRQKDFSLWYLDRYCTVHPLNNDRVRVRSWSLSGNRWQNWPSIGSQKQNISRAFGTLDWLHHLCHSLATLLPFITPSLKIGVPGYTCTTQVQDCRAFGSWSSHVRANPLVNLFSLDSTTQHVGQCLNSWESIIRPRVLHPYPPNVEGIGQNCSVQPERLWRQQQQKWQPRFIVWLSLF